MNGTNVLTGGSGKRAIVVYFYGKYNAPGVCGSPARLAQHRMVPDVEHDGYYSLSPLITAIEYLCHFAELRGVLMPALGKSTQGKLLKRDGRRCHYCGIVLEENGLQSYNPNGISIDHIIPIAHGGGDELENLVLCCRNCNRKKLTSEYGEFCFASWTDGMLLRFMSLEDQS